MDLRGSSVVSLALLVSATLAGCASFDEADNVRDPPSADAIAFEGTGAWNDPQAWGGRVPSPEDDVVIRNGSTVLITEDLVVRDLWIEAGAQLETAAGTKFTCNNLYIDALANVTFVATEINCGLFDPIGWGNGSGSTRLNPSSVIADRAEFHAGNLVMGIGGSSPAEPGATGRGHFATIVADEISIENTWLNVDFHYDFAPTIGDVYEVMSAERIDGKFNDLQEGDILDTIGDVALMYSATEQNIGFFAIPAGATIYVEDGDLLDGDAVIGAGVTARSRGDTTLGDVVVVRDAEFIAEPGSRSTCNNWYALGQSQQTWESASLTCDYFDPWGGTRLNPSYLAADLVELKGGTLTMGISGTSPASSRSVGQGHHAVIEGTDVYIDDTTLELELLYDFRPESGQEFHLIKAHSEFRFAGITNGQVVDSFFDIDFIAHVDDGLWLYAVPSGTQATFHNGDWTDYSDHDPGSAVLIGGQMQFSENAQVGDLFIPGAITVQGASLETGSVQASHFEGFDALTTSSGPVEGWGSGRSTIKMNPSHWSAPSFDVDATWTFGIAGTAPAGSERQGDGHYANIQANSIEATGTLAIQMLHGFVPTAGDIFELMKGSQVVASFDNAKNGDTVWSNGRTTLHLDITSDAVRLVATRG